MWKSRKGSIQNFDSGFGMWPTVPDAIERRSRYVFYAEYDESFISVSNNTKDPERVRRVFFENVR